MAERVTFRQHDLTRAIKGATAGGLTVARVEVEPGGKLLIITSGEKTAPPLSEFDQWMKANEGSA